MHGRFLVIFLTVAMAGLFGQFEPPGLFGPVTARLKAGDFAPDVRFDKMLHSATGLPWNPANLSTHPTVLTFFPYTSGNIESVNRWNALVDKFADRVQFVWITAEDESSLLPWLEEHPLNGWVFRDPRGETGHAYGLEMPAAVFVGADRKIAGFDPGILPQEAVLNAAIEGRISTAEVKPPATMAEALAQAKAMSESGMVRLEAESPRMPRPQDHKPNFPPSGTLHIAPAKDQLNGGNYAGPDYWSLQGFDLKDLISTITGVNPSHIDLPASLDTRTRYDFDLVLPAPEDREYMRTLIQREIERQFHFVITHENRQRNVYVITAGEKKPPAAADSPNIDFSFSAGYYSTALVDTLGQNQDPRDAAPPGIAAVSDIDISGTADEFCHFLEMELDRPVVNETGLQGEFEFQVKGREPQPGALPPHNFVERLRDQLGLIVTEAQRNVDTLVVTLTAQ
jgi:uncharacterized protein (TIGR03435 family)